MRRFLAILNRHICLTISLVLARESTNMIHFNSCYLFCLEAEQEVVWEWQTIWSDSQLLRSLYLVVSFNTLCLLFVGKEIYSIIEDDT